MKIRNMLLSVVVISFVFIASIASAKHSNCDNSFVKKLSNYKYAEILKYSVNDNYQLSGFETYSLGVAMMHMWGIGVPFDEKRANSLIDNVSLEKRKQIINCWEKAYEAGNKTAGVLFGIAIYEALNGVDDYALSRKVFSSLVEVEKIANFGVAASLHKLGKRKESSEAIKIMIDQSLVEENALASMFYFGIIFDKDLSEAIRLYEISAQKGDLLSVDFLIRIYSNRGAEGYDSKKASYWKNKKRDYFRNRKAIEDYGITLDKEEQ